MDEERPDLGTESYGGTRGYSADGTSKDAALADRMKGITNTTQRYVLIMAKQAGERGITVAEVREKNGSLHHGRVSSAITKQHIAGRLVALTERRNHAGVYVLPEHVSGRETRSYRRQLPKRTEAVIAETLAAHQLVDPWVDICTCGWITPDSNVDPADHRKHQAHEIRKHLAHEIVEALSAP